MRRLLALVVFSAALALAQDSFRLTPVVTGVTNPVDIQFPRDRSGRMFVVEQPGRIRLVKNGVLQTAAFLDIRTRISFGGERGLLAMALPPRFREHGRFYVHYTDTRGNTVIARYQSNGDTVDPASEQIVLQAVQPAANHNGGTIAFGPDGYLYIGLGDGGGSNDQFQNAQNRMSLLGKLLRIDVESGSATYTVPATNPFVGDSSYRPEIWGLGLRNPWRFSFDRATGDLWIADVGQNRAEEVNVQPASSRGGENYGWPVMEGLRCRVGTTCANQGMVPPVHEYTRENGDISVTGGFAYRGLAINFPGTYFFADYASGRMWGLTITQGICCGTGTQWTAVPIRGPGFNISAFGEDPNGELYAAAHGGGAIYRLERTSANRSPMNAASFATGLVPGMLSTMFFDGLSLEQQVVSAQTIPLPRSLAGIEVRVEGVSAPLLAVTQNQVNFQMPEGGATGTSISILRNGQTVSSIDISGAPRADARLPGIFSYSGSREAIVVRNSDFFLADTLEPGIDYFLYATGLGPVSNQPALGDAARSNPLSLMPVPPTITINGVTCPVTFAGLAPDFVGLYQINFRVPTNVPGGVQRLVLTAGGVPSNGNWVHIR